MYEILSKEELVPESVFRMKIKSPEIAKKRKAGQFVVLRTDEEGERIPLTIADADPVQGSITLIWQVVGVSTMRLAAKKVGESLADFAGPLGKPTHIENWGKVVCVCGGIGTAPLYPIAQALTKAGNEVYTIIGARNKDLLILVDEMKKICHQVEICTDDGSIGFKGFVSQLLEKWLTENNYKFNQCFAIGPVPMMKATAAVTKKYNLPTMVSLNPIMVDGTGMCGGCRVTIAGETKFCCVDGPEFDGHAVDYDELTQRLSAYRDHEEQARKLHQCRIGLGKDQ